MPLRYPTTSISNDIYGASDYDFKSNSNITGQVEIGKWNWFGPKDKLNSG